MITSFDKALVPVLVTLILGVAGWIGITGDMTVAHGIELLVTAGFVWLTPNRKKA